MAKQHSFIKLSGRVGDVSLMQTRNGFKARQATGIDGRRIKNDPAYERTRWAMAEFTHIVQSASLIYRSMQYSTNEVKDPSFRNKLTSILHKLKSLDVTNPNGFRKISEGLKSPEAINLAKQIDVNSDYSLLDVVPKGLYEIDRVTGEIHFINLNTSRDILKPLDCHKLGFNAIWVNIDFDKMEYTSKFTQKLMVDITDQPQDFNLSVPELPVGDGINFVFLKVLNYYLKSNGSIFLGKDLGYNSFGLIDAYLP